MSGGQEDMVTLVRRKDHLLSHNFIHLIEGLISGGKQSEGSGLK